VRFIHQWNVQQRLVKLALLARSLNAEQLALRLIQCLAVEYAIRPNQLLAAMRNWSSS